MNKKELRKAYKEGLLTRKQYAEKLVELEEKPKVRKEQRIYESLPENAFKKLLEHTNKIIHKISFILAYGAGLRISEVSKLTAKDIDFKKHTIFIRMGKGKKDRIVNTPKWLKQAHLKYFPIEIGERAINKAFNKASLRAELNSVLYTDARGIPRYRYKFHSLRHSFATRAIESGVPPNQLQLLLGHANLATTSKYTKANPTDAIQSILDKGV